MEGVLARVSSFRCEWTKTFKEDVLAMEEIRKMLKTIGIHRVFVPGRLGPQQMAAAYERLVPMHRMPLYQEPQENPYEVREECLCAR